MTVAEQIKNQFGPGTVERWYSAWRNKLKFKLTSYSQDGVGISFEAAQRVSVWDFVFIDGSRMTVRLYSK